jgi:hypothetical protein
MAAPTNRPARARSPLAQRCRPRDCRVADNHAVDATPARDADNIVEI